uniref:(California timema) hypothetical protein n=1 Tax=Timema californicum TaxID=61474 RepID=A0A7R9JI41_TIMCA|nr:unnamed protein product [Timema californicum]
MSSTTNTKSETLFRDVVCKFNILVTNCRSKYFDGAQNITRDINGVQIRLKSRRYDRRAHQHPILKSKIIDFVINANNFLISMRNAFQYLMYSTQQIIGGRKVELSPEEYVYAALVLYVDIIHIFLAFLMLSRQT